MAVTSGWWSGAKGSRRPACCCAASCWAGPAGISSSPTATPCPRPASPRSATCASISIGQRPSIPESGASPSSATAWATPPPPWSSLPTSNPSTSWTSRKDIIDVGRSIFPPGHFPLDDPRVKLHIEDGRFFLLMSEGGYDLITSEPPPPRLAGVASLYTREYFALIRSRLAEGGIVTYWLPVHDLDRRSAASVIRGFCDAFADCSLWTGSSLDWMLVGSRGARPRAGEEAFGEQWRREPTRSILSSIGLDSAERLGALFQGDGESLRDFVGDAPPLTDDFPQRIAPHGAGEADVAFYRAWMEPPECRRRFESSAFVRDAWPPALSARTLPLFDEQALYVDEAISLGRPRKAVDFARVTHALRHTDARALPIVLMGSTPQEVEIAESAAAAGQDDAIVSYLRALGAVSRREYSQAADLFDRVAEKEPAFGDLVFFRGLSRCLAGEAEAAAPHLAAARERAGDETARRFWETLGCP